MRPAHLREETGIFSVTLEKCMSAINRDAGQYQVNARPLPRWPASAHPPRSRETNDSRCDAIQFVRDISLATNYNSLSRQSVLAGATSASPTALWFNSRCSFRSLKRARALNKVFSNGSTMYRQRFHRMANTKYALHVRRNVRVSLDMHAHGRRWRSRAAGVTTGIPHMH